MISAWRQLDRETKVVLCLGFLFAVTTFAAFGWLDLHEWRWYFFSSDRSAWDKIKTIFYFVLDFGFFWLFEAFFAILVLHATRRFLRWVYAER